MQIDRPENHLFRMLKPILLALFTSASGAVAVAGPMQDGLPEIRLFAGSHEIKAEVADTDTSRQIGLMNRRYLEPEKGMLFIFKNSEIQCMWMKNTLIDLDVAFADEEGRILNVEQMKAGTTDIHCSKGKSRFALEMNRGWFNRKGLGAGAMLKIPVLAPKNQ